MEDFLYRFLSLYHRLPLPLRQALGWIYSRVPVRSKYGSFYEEYHERLAHFASLPNPTEVKRVQEEILISQVNAAIANVPFYNHLPKIHSAGDLTRYPVIGKQTVQEHHDDFLNPHAPMRRIRSNTGGSSGTPMEFFIEKNISRPKEKAHFDWFWGQFGYKPGSKILMVRGKPLPGNRLYEHRTIDNLLNVSCYGVREDNIQTVLEQINNFDPEFIHAYPSSLKVIVTLLEPWRKILHVRPRALFLGSEYLPESDREMFATFFKAPAVNWYGHSERLVHGGNCPYSAEYHFYPAYGYLELLDDQNVPVTVPGTEGRIVATGFDNRVMPLIRYDTGDRGVLSEKNQCLCGFAGISLRSISGRGQDVIVLSDGTRVSLTAFIFGQHPEAFKKIREFQVVQTEKGKIELKIVKNANYTSGDEKGLINTLRRAVNDKVSISVSYIHSVPKTSRGKNIFFVSDLKN